MSGRLYWDTSALLKLYAPEPDSPAFRALLLSRPEQPVASFLHRVELFFALRHKEARGELAAGAAGRIFDRYLRHVEEGRILEIPWGEDLAKSAKEALLPCLSAKAPVMLRSLEGLHFGALASAGVAKLVTTDKLMRRAAPCLGILLVDP